MLQPAAQLHYARSGRSIRATVCQANKLYRRESLSVALSVAGASIALAVSADVRQESSTEYQRFVSPESGFFFEYPEQWAVAIVRFHHMRSVSITSPPQGIVPELVRNASCMLNESLMPIDVLAAVLVREIKLYCTWTD